MERPRILLADDHTILLDAFKALLESEFEIVGAVTGRALLAECARCNPDVVVLDIATAWGSTRRLSTGTPGWALSACGSGCGR